MMHQIIKCQFILFLIAALSCVPKDSNYIWRSTQFVGHQYFEYSSDPSLYVSIKVRNKSDSLPNFYLLNKLDTIKLSYLMESSSLLVFKASKTDFEGESLNDTLYYTRELPQLIETYGVFYIGEGNKRLKKIPKASNYSTIFGIKLIDE